MKRISLLLLLLLLAACGGDAPFPTQPPPTAVAAAPTALSPAAADVPPTEPPPTPTATAAAATLPPTATTGAPPATATGVPAPPTAAAAPATPTTAAQPTLIPTPELVALRFNTALILDASGSMLADLGGQTRLAVAQDAIASVSAGLPSSVNASLWVYGHRTPQDDQAASCQDIEELIPLGPVEPRAFEQAARSLNAMGYTPITTALLQAAESLPAGTGQRNSIVLVSDGEETCGGDPCALAAQLAASDAQITIHSIGLAVDDATRDQLMCIADAGGGSYFDAESAEGLSAALEGAASAAADNSFQLAEGMGRPSNVRVSPDGRHVYVSGTVAEAILIFARDEGTGRLSYSGLVRNREMGIVGMDSPLGMAVAPDGGHIYVTGDQLFTVVVLARDAASGGLSFVETLAAFPPDNSLNRIYGITISPDGNHVYALGQDFGRSDDALASFARDPATGRLTPLQTLRSSVDGVGGLGEVTNLVVAPDGRHVYVTGEDRKVGVFARDAATGLLTFVQELREGEDVDRGLLGGQRIAVSADNQFVYVTARRGAAVTVFARDPDSGMLTFSSQIRDHVGGARPDDAMLWNLSGAHGLALGPEGNTAYIAGGINDFLVALTRSPDDGSLAFLQSFQDDVDGIDGLENGYDIAISPDGRSLYIVGFDDEALAVFQRDPAVGTLQFVEVVRNRSN